MTPEQGLRGWLRRVRKRIRTGARAPRVHDEWAIGLLSGRSLHGLGTPSGLRNPILSARDVGSSSAYVADPFLLRTDQGWLLYFETYDRRREKGEIAVASSRDGRRWKYRGIALRESFHLSYPYVFQHDGAFYMIPESHEVGEVRLYRAEKLPNRWVLASTLLQGRAYSDPSIFFDQGRWWLLAEASPVPRSWDTLHLFSSERLEGPWAEHPASPVSRTPHAARPAGRVVKVNGRWVRFAQVCTPDYGTAVRGFEIECLTPTEYRDRELPGGLILGPGGKGEWNATGSHHLDLHLLDTGEWIAAVDGCRRRSTGATHVPHCPDVDLTGEE